MLSSEALNSSTALNKNLFFVLRNKGYLVGFSYPHSCRITHCTSSIWQQKHPLFHNSAFSSASLLPSQCSRSSASGYGIRGYERMTFGMPT